MNQLVADFTLDRFVDAQASTYEQALAEIQAGHKHTHWMWFIFPQIAGLGSSPVVQHYAITDVAEAQAYLAHPLLGPRLMECAGAVLDAENRSAYDIFGSPDDMKLHSSATLFAHVSAPGSVFHQVLDRYFDGEVDARTMALIA